MTLLGAGSRMARAIGACVVFAAACAPGANASPPAPARSTPIIAEVLGDPARFVGRPVAIYGLVVEAREEGRRFLLQDVSQAPLLVVAPPRQRVTQGSQLMVYGIVRRANGQVLLAGDELHAVQVVAGGGCC